MANWRVMSGPQTPIVTDGVLLARGVIGREAAVVAGCGVGRAGVRRAGIWRRGLWCAAVEGGAAVAATEGIGVALK
ncbi:MAG: hypothetical protein ACXVUE_02805 [Solirubrobacteraceae bacterium]